MKDTLATSMAFKRTGRQANPEDWCTVPEAAALLQVAPVTLYRWGTTEKPLITMHRIGQSSRHVFIWRPELDELISARRMAGLQK